MNFFLSPPVISTQSFPLHHFTQYWMILPTHADLLTVCLSPCLGISASQGQGLGLNFNHSPGPWGCLGNMYSLSEWLDKAGSAVSPTHQLDRKLELPHKEENGPHEGVMFPSLLHSCGPLNYYFLARFSVSQLVFSSSFPCTSPNWWRNRPWLNGWGTFPNPSLFG